MQHWDLYWILLTSVLFFFMILYDTFILESNSSDRLNLKSSIRVKLTNFDKLQTKNEYTQGGKEKNLLH